jgi:hypothetical protein
MAAPLYEESKGIGLIHIQGSAFDLELFDYRTDGRQIFPGFFYRLAISIIEFDYEALEGFHFRGIKPGYVGEQLLGCFLT